MEKKKLKKLTLRKETVSSLSSQQQSQLMGGRVTTSFGYDEGRCTGFMCCDYDWSLPKSCYAQACDGFTESKVGQNCSNPCGYYY